MIFEDLPTTPRSEELIDKERMVAVHGGDFEWDEESEIVSYRFERR